MVDARVYISHTKAYSTLRNDLFIPIQAGCAHAEYQFPDMLRDHTGDHISGQYSQWSELTTLYWVWKNTQHDYVGWMPCQRFLSLSTKESDDSSLSNFSSQFVRHYGWAEKKAHRLLRQYDVVVPRTYAVQDVTVLQDVKTPYDFFIRESGSEYDINVFLAVIRDLYPEKYVHALEFLHGSVMRPWHVFIMKHSLFHAYSTFLFTVLTELKKRHNMDGVVGFQRHNWMFLAEFLLNIEITYCIKNNKELRILERPIVYIDKNDFSHNRNKIIKNIRCHEKNIKNAPPKPISFGGKVHIVMSFDDKYLKPACATLNSLLSHTSNHQDLVFYILHDNGLSDDVSKKLRDTYKEIEFIFILVNESFVHSLPLNRKHINVNTYYRLLIHQEIPNNIGRILYLDTDIAVCHDIVDLWNIDIGSKIIAGSPDETGAVGSWRLFGKKMNQHYINAGVMLFDINNARNKYKNIDFLYARSFYENKSNITMQDQDILNIAYKDDIKLLPLAWNVPSSVFYRKSGHSEGDHEGKENFFAQSEIEVARHFPKIIHFTGRQKPWRIGSMHTLRKVFWIYVKKTMPHSLKEYISSFDFFINIKKNRIIIKNRDSIREFPLSLSMRRKRKNN